MSRYVPIGLLILNVVVFYYQAPVILDWVMLRKSHCRVKRTIRSLRSAGL